MSNKNEQLTSKRFEILELIAAFGISLVAKELVKKGWEKTTQTPAPENPYSSRASVKEVILFSVSLALVSTGIKLLTRNKLAKQWDKMGGDLPKTLE